MCVYTHSIGRLFCGTFNTVNYDSCNQIFIDPSLQLLQDAVVFLFVYVGTALCQHFHTEGGLHTYSMKLLYMI